MADPIVAQIKYPGASSTVAWSINSSGQIAGYYRDSTGNYGFINSSGVFTSIAVPGAQSTQAAGINVDGQVVGTYYDSTGMHGFLDIGGIFTKIDVPGARSTSAYGINSTGQIVGYYSDSKGDHGFIETNGSFTAIDMPGASYTYAYGVNDAGQVVGSYQDGTGQHGFVETNGVFRTIDVDGATNTAVSGINNLGQIVGLFLDSGRQGGFVESNGFITKTSDIQTFTVSEPHGISDSGQIVGSYDSVFGRNSFVGNNGSFTPLVIPGATSVDAFGINATGQIVGSFRDSSGEHGFVGTNGAFSTIDAPSATYTEAHGINALGQIVGSYGSSSGTHGFLQDNGNFTTIDVPNASYTAVFGINQTGQIVGSYSDNAGTHGFSRIDGNFTIIDGPGASYTEAFGVNSFGQIVGTYQGNGGYHGFLVSNGVFVTIDAPGATSTSVYGFNASGQIVGVYHDAVGDHGFVDNNGVFTTVDIPISVPLLSLGINDAGQLVGAYSPSYYSYTGFVTAAGDTTPPSVSSISLGSSQLSLATATAGTSLTIKFSEAVKGFDTNDILLPTGVHLSSAGIASADGGITWTGVLQANSGVETSGPVSVGTVDPWTDLAGNFGLKSDLSLSPTLTVDTKAPVVTEVLLKDTGTADQITSNPTVTGMGDANALVTLMIDKTTATTKADANGAWSYTPTGLADGPHTIMATETDAAGNAGSASLTFTLDTKAPVLTATLARDTGTSATDKITADPTVTGTGEANALVTFTIDNKAITATTKADANGVWTYSPTGLADGQHVIVASETDAAGNTGSASLTFMLDTNRAPIAVDDTASVMRGKTVTGNVLTNDTDPDHDALAVVAPGTFRGANGTLTLKADGSYSYLSTTKSLPDSGFAKDTFDFKISDGHSHTVAERLTVFTTADGKTSVFDGSAGGQTLKAGAGSQILVGGPNDILTGGDGADTFVFGPNAGKNTITDFDPRTDKIVLDHTLLPSLSQIFSGSAYIQQTNGDLTFSNGHGDTLTLQHTSLVSFLLNAGHDILIV